MQTNVKEIKSFITSHSSIGIKFASIDMNRSFANANSMSVKACDIVRSVDENLSLVSLKIIFKMVSPLLSDTQVYSDALSEAYLSVAEINFNL